MKDRLLEGYTGIWPREVLEVPDLYEEVEAKLDRTREGHHRIRAADLKNGGPRYSLQSRNPG